MDSWLTLTMSLVNFVNQISENIMQIIVSDLASIAPFDKIVILGNFHSVQGLHFRAVRVRVKAFHLG